MSECESCGWPLKPQYVDDSGVVYAYDCDNQYCTGEKTVCDCCCCRITEDEELEKCKFGDDCCPTCLKENNEYFNELQAEKEARQ